MRAKISHFLALLWSTVPVAVRRLLANRRMAAGMLLGITVAVAAASSVPVFTDGALQRVLQIDLTKVDRKLPAAVHLAYFVDDKHPTTVAAFQAADQIAREDGPKLIGLPLQPFVRYGSLDVTNAVPVDPMKVNPDTDRWINLAFMTDLAKHIKLIDGRLPQDGKVGDGYEALVEDVFLEKQDITVGSQLYVPINRDKDAPRVKVTIVGTFRRTNPDEPYWFLGSSFDKVIFLTEPTFANNLLTEQGVKLGQFSWYYGIANSAVRVDDVPRLLDGLSELEARAGQALPGTKLFDGPMELLGRYAYRAGQLQLLLLLLAMPLLFVTVYFLVVTSGMVVEGQKQEIAVLRSRGASLWQVIAIYLTEGAVLGLLALGLGYPLGLVLARAMGAVSGFLQFVDRTQPPLQVPPAFWGYGLAAALVAMLAYVAPVLPASRQSIVSYKQESARKLKMPLWAKYGLDLLCIAVAVYGYYTLHQRQLAGNTISLLEPLDLLAPVLFVTGFGLLLLRIWPLLASLALKLTEKRSQTPLYLTLTQLARSPGNYTPVVLLLTLTVGMGLYSAAAARTLERNTADRIQYQDGADVFMSERWEYVSGVDGNPLPSGAPPQSSGAQDSSQGQAGTGGENVPVVVQPPPWNVHYDLPGVAHAAQVRTEDVTPKVGGKAVTKARLMAINPQDFGQVAWFRSDLAPYHINEYLNLLAEHEDAVLVTPAFLQKNKLKPGDQISLVGQNGQEAPLIVYAAISYWPSLYPQDGDFFIANLSYIEEQLGLKPYDIWLKMEPGARMQPVVDELQSKEIVVTYVSDHRQEMIQARRDPELNGLLGGLTSSFLLSALITLLGFWLYAALSLRSRVLQFGMLRAIGLSARQLLSAVALEQVLTVGLGVASGTGLGLTTANLFVPFLQQGDSKTAHVPPFVVMADPADRIRLYIVLLLMLLVGLGGLMLALSRLRIHEALKLGEDQ